MGRIHHDYSGDARYYVDADSPHHRAPGVTSVLDMLGAPFLPTWSANMAAELAVTALPIIERMAQYDRVGAVKYLARASDRYRDARAKFGSEAHDLFERMIRGERITSVPSHLERVYRHFRQFLAAVNPELVRAEDVAWSETHDYAGSFDAILRIWFDAEGNITPDRSGFPRLIIVDWKTSKSLQKKVAMQLAGYSRADWIIDTEGERIPMPEVDGGAVLHITDKGWSFPPADIGDDQFRAFLACRVLFHWQNTLSRTAIGKPWASSGQLVTGTQRRGK